jgi:hypothetical protein
MRKIVVHDDDEVAMWVTDGTLSDGKVMETDVMPLAEMLLRDDDGGSAIRHWRRVSGPNVEMVGVAIFIGKMELYDPVSMDVYVDAFEVEGGAKYGVAARDKGGTVGLHIDVRIGVDERCRLRAIPLCDSISGDE